MITASMRYSSLCPPGKRVRRLEAHWTSFNTASATPRITIVQPITLWESGRMRNSARAGV